MALEDNRPLPNLLAFRTCSGAGLELHVIVDLDAVMMNRYASIPRLYLSLEPGCRH